MRMLQEEALAAQCTTINTLHKRRGGLGMLMLTPSSFSKQLSRKPRRSKGETSRPRHAQIGGWKQQNGKIDYYSNTSDANPNHQLPNNLQYKGARFIKAAFLG